MHQIPDGRTRQLGHNNSPPGGTGRPKASSVAQIQSTSSQKDQRSSLIGRFSAAGDTSP
jgi:hypothetical protein